MSSPDIIRKVREKSSRDAVPSRASMAFSNDASTFPRIVDIVMMVVITACCLAIEVLMPDQMKPDMAWLMFAPGCGVIFGSIPALLLRRQHKRIKRNADEKDQLVGLLLKDYAAERSDWLWSIDQDNLLRGVSEKFAANAGQSSVAMEGVDFPAFLRKRLPADSVALNAIEIALRQRKTFFDIETPIRIGNCELYWRLAGKPVFREGRYAGFMGTACDITAETIAKDRINFLAHHDSLTGLANRVRFTDRLNECVARLERYGSAFTVLYLDLDRFKSVNDTLGHQAGDQLLVEVGRRLQSTLRETDLTCRLGGDEFAVILPDNLDGTTIAALATRMIDDVTQPYDVDGNTLTIGLSIGIAIAPINGTRPDQIIRNADLALYRAKDQGGNCYCFFESRMDFEIRERRALELELAEALKRGEFVLHYQPLISVADGLVSGFEALIRWNHPIRGMVAPAEFIPIAEQSSLIAQIGEWTVGEACRALSRMPERFSIAVNLSARHFRLCDIAQLVRTELEATGVAAQRLELEITESLLIDNPDAMAAKLAELKEIGVTIAMDDFGTGFSSLSYLLKFPFDKIKIDRSFVSASTGDKTAREILRAIVGLAKTLDIRITAEGVETQDQAEFLRGTGCDLLQGYLFSRPLPEEAFAPHIDAARKAGLAAGDAQAGQDAGDTVAA